jgi:predicted DCC family thiol-disulfide oxidoreductase YuxK
MGITFEYQLTGLIFAPFFRIERLFELPRKLWLGRKAAVEPAATVPEPAAGRASEPAEGSGAQPASGPAIQPAIPRAIIYYDGECGLCDRFVQFVLRHDHDEYFQFATLQSDSGRRELSRLGLSGTDLQTVVLVEGGGSYVRSTASLRVCRRLGGLWPLFYAFIAVPRPWRDGIYSLVARNRKRWFKPPAECTVMPPEWRHRFVR